MTQLYNAVLHHTGATATELARHVLRFTKSTMANALIRTESAGLLLSEDELGGLWPWPQPATGDPPPDRWLTRRHFATHPAAPCHLTTAQLARHANISRRKARKWLQARRAHHRTTHRDRRIGAAPAPDPEQLAGNPSPKTRPLGPQNAGAGEDHSPNNSPWATEEAFIADPDAPITLTAKQLARLINYSEATAARWLANARKQRSYTAPRGRHVSRRSTPP